MTTTPTHALTVWGTNQLFAFSGLDGPTDFDRGLVAQSRADGLQFRLPGPAAVSFGKVTKALFGSDWAQLETDLGTVRFAFIDTHHLLIEGPARFSFQHSERVEVAHLQSGDRLLIAPVGTLNDGLLTHDLNAEIAARQVWAKNAPVAESPLASKAIQQMKSMVYAPQGQFRHRFTTPDRWPHREAWLWDSAFHAIGYRHLDPALARHALAAVFDTQLPNGQVGISFAPHSTRTHRSQPPILAWAVREVQAVVPDDAWLAELVPGLRRYLRWFEQHRAMGTVFGWVEDDGALGSVCDESGMDNSPRFAGASVVKAVDLSCYMAQEYQAMAELDPNGGWAAKAARLETEMEQFWDAELGFYCDIDPATDRSTGVQAVTGFLPLILGQLSRTRAQSLIDALQDPARFGSALPIPSIARNQKGYSKDMWQGPVWVNMNWMIARGFARCGATDVAEDLRARTLDAMTRWHGETGSIFEYYDDDNATSPPALPRKGRNDPEVNPERPTIHQVIHDYGWSATLALDWIQRGAV
ncbi:hypothetical protein ACMU_00930 [Actibacterium mucosum KCTC 23349]|uniref:Mannosylglycerate hydrolase MGH1-like glycoside hydrolase domain-containing protein n=1 Tax=Actibacterium mucosum KCTC 23349 TaxID=1454373 RepID=A0A037ZQF8_9RHOB|nr:trehalase family glycosidase [Actibacterium mucosum]KAJ57087.1 hypothetical protein ACMU_00930 [Actibacterium mucosum KCTC 23349]